MSLLGGNGGAGTGWGWIQPRLSLEQPQQELWGMLAASPSTLDPALLLPPQRRPEGTVWGEDTPPSPAASPGPRQAAPTPLV